MPEGRQLITGTHYSSPFNIVLFSAFLAACLKILCAFYPYVGTARCNVEYCMPAVAGQKQQFFAENVRDRRKICAFDSKKEPLTEIILLY